MFDEILNDGTLPNLIRGTCAENDIGVDFDAELVLGDGGADHERVLILKVDAFYQTRHNPPPSIDCLIIVKCDSGGYDLYLIELRNTGHTSMVKHKDIRKKFETVVDDFFQKEFPHIFVDPGFPLNNIKCFLVTDPLRLGRRSLTPQQYKEAIKGTVLDAYGQVPPLKMLGRLVPIEALLPTPVIARC